MTFYSIPFLPFLLCGIFLSADNSLDDDPVRVAGRDIKGWVADFSSKNEVVRLRAVKSLGAFGPAAIGPLAKALEDSSDAVQYWAASHLGDIAKRNGNPVAGHKLGPSIRKRLLELKKKGQGIGIAANYALCQIDGVEKHLDGLTKYLSGSERGAVCSTVEFLGKIGPPAQKAVKVLEKMYENHGDYHVQGACKNAIRKIKKLPSP